MGRHHDARSSRRSCRSDRPGAARRSGRRPRGLVGEGLLPPGGRGGQRRSSLPSSRRPANRSSSSNPHRSEMIDKARAALAAGQPPDFLYQHPCRLELPSGLTRTGSSTSRARSARSWTCSMPTPSKCPPRSTARRAGAASTRCRWAGVPTTSMSGTASWSAPASRSPTFRRSGSLLVLLVRPGAAGGAQGPGPRRHLGRRAAHVAPLATPKTGSYSSSSPTGRPGSTTTAGSRSKIPRYGRESSRR